MAAGLTYAPIATTTLSSAVSTYTFSSIPSTYTDLVLVTNLSSSTNANIYFRVNGDTTTNYSFNFLVGDSTTPTGYRGTNNSVGTATWTGSNMNNTWTTCVANFMNYSNTTTYKTFITRYGGISASQGSSETTAVVNLWRSTAAINSITVLTLSPNYAIGSTLTLYGIEAA